MLELELISREDDYPRLEIRDKRSKNLFNCFDELDMRMLVGLINDEICYLNETGADAEMVLSKIDGLINSYKRRDEDG